MKWTQVVFIVLVVLCGFADRGIAAQARLLPSAVGVDFGVGPTFPRALEPPCPDGRPVVLGARLSWVVHRIVQLQATASRFGNGTKASCGDTLPCLRDQPCPRENGIGQQLMPVGVRFLLEPMGREAQWSPRFGVGAGRLAGDGESYAEVIAGIRHVIRSRLSLTVEMERLFFRAPVAVRDHWTNELLARSRDAVAINLIRAGIRWGS